MPKRKHFEIDKYENLDDNNYFLQYDIINNIKINELKKFGSFSNVFSIKCGINTYAFKVTKDENEINAANEAYILNKFSKASSPFVLNLIRFGYSNILNSFVLQVNYFKYNLSNVIKEISLVDSNRYHIYDCISKGLKYLHINNVIHCDIKPENILISSNLNDVRICDFNISIVNNKQNILSNVYKVTRYYRPPELFLKKYFNEKIDIWSFGIIIYIMESGKEFIINKGNIYYYLTKIQKLVGKIQFNDSDLRFIRNSLKEKELYSSFLNFDIEAPLINALSKNKYFNLLKNCLKFNINERYSASQVCDFFINLKYKIA